MFFSVTREVGWEADDEDDEAPPFLGMKKRYRLIVDFSRRPSKNPGCNKQPSSGFVLSDNDNHYEIHEAEDSSNSAQHFCYGCGELRSEQYHLEHPPRRGRTPRPSLCTQCRHYRKKRLAYRAHEGGHRHVNRFEARVDNREWCANCGTLRSDRYHRKLLSGELPPWNEICGHCMFAVEKMNKLERLRVYYEELESPDCTNTNRIDPLRSSLQQHRSSPYALTMTSSSAGTRSASAATSASSLAVKVGDRLDESSGGNRSPFAVSVQEMEHTSSETDMFPKLSRVGARKPAFKDPASKDNGRDPQKGHQGPEGIREDQQPQPTKPAHHSRQQDESSGPLKQPKVEAWPREHHVSIPAAPLPFPPAASGTANRHWRAHHNVKSREPREQPDQKPSPYERYHNRRGHRKQRSTSFTEPPCLDESICSSMSNTVSKPQAGAQPKQQPPTGSRKPTPPPSAQSMGVSDMYWASAKGKTEAKQACTSGGYFFPASVYAFTPGSGPGAHTSRDRDYDDHAHATSAFTRQSSSRGTNAHHDYGYGQDQVRGHSSALVWEVDSDEAAEIEMGHARPAAGGRIASGVGKARMA